MTIREIVKKYLETNGYDGLCLSDEECGCGFEDIMSCNNISSECEAAHEEVAPQDSQFDILMFPGKRKKGNSRES